MTTVHSAEFKVTNGESLPLDRPMLVRASRFAFVLRRNEQGKPWIMLREDRPGNAQRLEAIRPAGAEHYDELQRAQSIRPDGLTPLRADETVLFGRNHGLEIFDPREVYDQRRSSAISDTALRNAAALDMELSREHFAMTVLDPNTVVFDDHSKFGTFVTYAPATA